MVKRENQVNISEQLVSELQSIRDAVGGVYLLRVLDIILEIVRKDKSLPKTRKKKMYNYLSNLFKKIEKEIL